jgi:hypothetical protein
VTSLKSVPPSRHERLLYFVELLRTEILLLEGLEIDLDQQQGNPALAQAIQLAHAGAHPRRVEATLRVWESGGAFLVAKFAPGRCVLRLRLPWHKAQGYDDATGQRLSAQGRYRFRSPWDRRIVSAGNAVWLVPDDNWLGPKPGRIRPDGRRRGIEAAAKDCVEGISAPGVARASSPCRRIPLARCPCYIMPPSPLARLTLSRFLTALQTVSRRVHPV